MSQSQGCWLAASACSSHVLEVLEPQEPSRGTYDPSMAGGQDGTRAAVVGLWAIVIDLMVLRPGAKPFQSHTAHLLILVVNLGRLRGFTCPAMRCARE